MPVDGGDRVKFGATLAGTTGVGAVLAGALLLAPAQTVLATGEGTSDPTALVAGPPDPDDAAALVAGRQDRSRGSAGEGVDVASSRSADTHVQADPLLRRLLAGRPYSVIREGSWQGLHTSRGIGLVREIGFAEPQDFAMQPWPAVRYDEATDVYTQHRYNVEVRGATSLVLFIDAQRGVVGMQPDPEAQEIAGPGNQRFNERSTH